MFNVISKGIAKVFGTKSDRDIKGLWPYVEKVNDAWKKLEAISDDELRAASDELRATIDAALQEIDDEIKALRNRANEEEGISIEDKEGIFNQVDALEERRNKELEEVLMEVLPQAFAVVKETARRLKDNKQLKVTATDHDRAMATKAEHVVIEGQHAIWKNQWVAAGNTITWEMVHYDVQLIGGVVLHQGKIAEMATGEGKTLVATLPAFLNALARRGVHVVTVNDYLAKRDAEWMAPLFQFHGISIDCIDKHQPNSEQRRQAYMADITYGTNNEFGFDYLRDNMAREPEELVQRRHHFAMVDEVDSVLVDEARTPLIISGPVPKGDVHEYDTYKPRISGLVEKQRKLVGNYLQEAKKLLKEGNEKEGGLALFRAFRGLPKYKPLIKFLSEPGMKATMQKTENTFLAENAKRMPEADAPLFFVIEEKNNQVQLTDKGAEELTKGNEDASFFVIPDLGEETAKLEGQEELTEAEVLEKKDALIRDYSAKAERIHTINQLLKAYTLFERDQEYIIQDGKVKIVDEQTGRVMDGRRYSDGLHQALEAKESVKIEEATQTYATITLQNYFRMYHKLSGMTGTAETEAGELWEIYKLDVVVIPTNRPILRDDAQDLVFKTVREKFNAVIDEIVRLTEEGRPVLVGTTSVEVSEVVSRMLTIRKIEHQVLNAKQHAKEADVVANAGKSGTVTIATNMAGRGTDIKLTPESKEAGGLAIIGTERHDSRRVDRQLRGRSGRQGDPGSSQFYVSLEDTLMRLFSSERIIKFMDRLGVKEGEVIQHSMVTKSIERAQKKVEENNFATRKRLLEYDDVMNSQREVIYKRRHNALQGERLDLDIVTIVYEACDDIVASTLENQDFDAFQLNCISTLGLQMDIDFETFKGYQHEALADELYNKAMEQYQRKNDQIAERALPLLQQIQEERGAVIDNIMVPFSDGTKQLGVRLPLTEAVESKGKAMIKAMEKMTALAFIDEAWKEHLRDMDDLKQSVQTASYEQKDPLLIYKFEAYELFKTFIKKVNEDTVSFLMKAGLHDSSGDQVQAAKTQRPSKQNYQESKAEVNSPLSGGGQQGTPNRLPVSPPRPSQKKYMAAMKG